MHKAIILLGTNIDPEKNIERAKFLLQKEFKKIIFSKSVRTAPIGYKDQDDFLNAVAFITTDLLLEEIERKLKNLEKKLGRKRDPNNKNGPRTIDMDIIVFNGQTASDDFITKPFVNDLIADLTVK